MARLLEADAVLGELPVEEEMLVVLGLELVLLELHVRVLRTVGL